MTENNKLAIVGSKNNLKSIMEMPEFKDSVKSVAGKYMTADHIIKAALLAVSRQPKLLQCTRASFLQSAIKAAELGLDFAGQTGQGYLVPFKNECQFIPGYQGFIEIAYRSEKVTYIDAQLVYENDDCEYSLGSAPFIDHKPNMKSDRGKVLFGYAIVKLKDSDLPKIELMSIAEINKIKERSRAKDSGPWKTDESEMRRKTVVRRVFKYIPKTPEITAALQADNQQYDLGIEVEEVKDDNSNLGNEAVANRMKKRGRPKKTVEAKVEDVEPDPETKQKAAEQAEKLRVNPEMFLCQYDKCGKAYEKKDLDENGCCPECGYEVKKIE